MACEDWNQMSLGSQVDRVVVLKDAPTKAIIADLETRAISGSRIRNKQGALSDPAVARRVRNETIAGVLVLICLAVFTYFFFFFVLD